MTFFSLSCQVGENRFSQFLWLHVEQKAYFINRQQSLNIYLYRYGTKVRRGKNYLCDVQQVRRWHFAISENSLWPWHWKIKRKKTSMQIDKLLMMCNGDRILRLIRSTAFSLPWITFGSLLNCLNDKLSTKCVTEFLRKDFAVKLKNFMKKTRSMKYKVNRKALKVYQVPVLCEIFRLLLSLDYFFSVALSKIIKKNLK